MSPHFRTEAKVICARHHIFTSPPVPCSSAQPLFRPLHVSPTPLLLPQLLTLAFTNDCCLMSYDLYGTYHPDNIHFILYSIECLSLSTTRLLQERRNFCLLWSTENTHCYLEYVLLKNLWGENQDGDVGRYTVPPRPTRTDGKSNGREV